MALAYYDKGRSVQYDGTTIVDKIGRAVGGKTRSTNQEPPEYATPHETFYSVCSDFMHQVYWETFHYQFMGSAGSCWTGGIVKLPETNPEVIYHYEKDSGKDPKEALHELYAPARLGRLLRRTGKSAAAAAGLRSDPREPRQQHDAAAHDPA